MSSEVDTGIDLGSRKSEHVFFIRALFEGRITKPWPVLLYMVAFVTFVVWLSVDSDCGWIIGLLLGVGGIFAVWRLWPIKVELYEKGMTYGERKGIRRLPWGQIEQVWRAVPDNGLGRFVIQSNSGETVELNWTLVNFAELGKAIEEGVHQVLRPKYLAVMQSGQRILFGPFALDYTGIYFKQKHIPWGEVSSINPQPVRVLIATAEGTIPVIVVKKKQKLLAWASVKEDKIPNVYTFYNLVSLFHRGQVDLEVSAP